MVLNLKYESVFTTKMLKLLKFDFFLLRLCVCFIQNREK